MTLQVFYGYLDLMKDKLKMNMLKIIKIFRHSEYKFGLMDHNESLSIM